MVNELLETEQEEIQLIVFRLGHEEYAVPITCVQEIIMPQEPTRIPKSPSFIEGVINLRGHVVSVLDGRKKFQIEIKDDENTNESRIMVLDVNDEIVGLIVDAVYEVVYLKTDDIEPVPADMGANAESIWGVGKIQDRLLILLNPEKLVDVEETGCLRSLTKAVKSATQTGQEQKQAEVKKSVAVTKP